MFITEYFITQFVIFLTYVPDEANYMNLTDVDASQFNTTLAVN